MGQSPAMARHGAVAGAAESFLESALPETPTPLSAGVPELLPWPTALTLDGR